MIIHILFSAKQLIQRELECITEKRKNHFSGKAVSQLERLMAENNIYLIWSGHISPDVGKEVLSFTETKLTEDDIESNLQKKSIQHTC